MGDQLGSVAEALLIEEDRGETHGGQLVNAGDGVQMGARSSQFAGLLNQAVSALLGLL